MRLRVLPLAVLSVILVGRAVPGRKSGAPAPPVDSMLGGRQRAPSAPNRVLTAAGLGPASVHRLPGDPAGRTALFGTGVRTSRGGTAERGGKLFLVFTVKERPLLKGWGAARLSRIAEGPSGTGSSWSTGSRSTGTRVERSRAAIDPLQKEGYYAAVVKGHRRSAQPGGAVRVVSRSPGAAASRSAKWRSRATGVLRQNGGEAHGDPPGALPSFPASATTTKRGRGRQSRPPAAVVRR